MGAPWQRAGKTTAPQHHPKNLFCFGFFIPWSCTRANFTCKGAGEDAAGHDWRASEVLSMLGLLQPWVFSCAVPDSLRRVNIFSWGRAARGGAGNEPRQRHRWEDNPERADARVVPAESGLPSLWRGCAFLFSLFSSSLMKRKVPEGVLVVTQIIPRYSECSSASAHRTNN